MHIIHLGVIVKAPDYISEKNAREALTDVLIDAKADAHDRLSKLDVRDTSVMLHNSEFIVTEESPAKRRLDWLLTHPNMRVQGSDLTGWLIWDFQETGPEYAAGRTAYAAIDAAIAKEAS